MYNSHYCIECRLLLYVSRAYCYLLGHDTMQSGRQVSSVSVKHAASCLRKKVIFPKWCLLPEDHSMTFCHFSLHGKDILFHIKGGAHKRSDFF